MNISLSKHVWVGIYEEPLRMVLLDEPDYDKYDKVERMFVTMKVDAKSEIDKANTPNEIANILIALSTHIYPIMDVIATVKSDPRLGPLDIAEMLGDSEQQVEEYYTLRKYAKEKEYEISRNSK